jgi:ATP-binding cassette, subfamily F, member 3
LTDAARHLRGIAKFRKGGKADTNDKFAKGFFANRGKETVRRAKALERRIEILQTDEKVDKPKAGYALKLDFGEMPRSGQMVLHLENVGHSFDVSRFTADSSNVNRQISDATWLVRNANTILRHGERIALVGANGTGKSTLLKIIVGELEPAEGFVRMGANVRIGYMPQEQETLDVNSTPLALIRALMPVDETDARHFLHYFMFEGEEVFTPIGKLSYGERARLILAKLVSEKSNLLILDEPINHLDIPSRERFEAALDAFPGTILVAAHDRAFIDRFASGIWAIEHQTLRAYLERAEMAKNG